MFFNLSLFAVASGILLLVFIIISGFVFGDGGGLLFVLLSAAQSGALPLDGQDRNVINEQTKALKSRTPALALWFCSR